MRCLMWFREDLRSVDNTALYHAAKQAKDGLIGLYIISIEAWQQHDIANCRVAFILKNLVILSDTLAALNIPLLIVKTTKTERVPQILTDLMQQHQVQALFFNQQYEVNEAKRDTQVEQKLRAVGLKVFSYRDQVILPLDEIFTKTQGHYTKFTPYKKTWIKQAHNQKITLVAAPVKQKKLHLKSDKVPKKIAGWDCTIALTDWPAGETEAQSRLQQFIKQRLKKYHQTRNFPAINGTSTLSPYLTAGIISSRQCLLAALRSNKHQFDQGNQGVVTWINELIWAEFYKYILYHFPRVSMSRAFKLETETLAWSKNKTHFNAWCNGMTGFPLVDAAMRQLNQTGWMHNRLRLLTAMFLVKDLQLNWQWGERYFMQHLLDGDLAANNGGWQWAASTGTDAAPYFRIFNPTTQSKRFDPDGEFIKRFCPELSQLDKKSIHAPYAVKHLNPTHLAYPKPIIDHAAARQATLKMFKANKTNSAKTGK